MRFSSYAWMISDSLADLYNSLEGGERVETYTKKWYDKVCFVVVVYCERGLSYSGISKLYCVLMARQE